MAITLADVESISKVASIAIAAGAFAWSVVWGVLQYFKAERDQRDHRRMEASRPFLEKQLEFYLDATRSAVIIAVSKDKKDVSAATERFCELFWGELALVEDEKVESAMIAFKTALEEAGDLEQASLDLAHACRNSLARSWGTPAWKSHYRKPQKKKGQLQ